MIRCAFCGHPAVIGDYTPPHGKPQFFVECRNVTCEARGPWRSTPDEAVKANRPAQEGTPA